MKKQFESVQELMVWGIQNDIHPCDFKYLLLDYQTNDGLVDISCVCNTPILN